jgi:hypothetical protein
MKTTKWIVGFLTIGTLVLAGCGKGKADQKQGSPPIEMRGVKVDLPKLRETMPPALAPVVSELTAALRYGQFAQAKTELQKLSTDPSLTDEQKKLVNDVAEQVKQMEAKSGGK